MTFSTNICEPKMFEFADISPTLKKTLCDDLRDKDPKIVTINIFFSSDQLTESGAKIN